jgi:dethiobiotin synthetase
VVVVSRHYLGSINHTLLTLECLQQRGLQSCLLFNGDENPATEQIILKRSGVPLLGRIADEEIINREIIRAYAKELAPALHLL